MGQNLYTKSGIMLGLGETEEELFTAMRDLRAVDCDILTLGQYLQPTREHLPVTEFVTPRKFAEYTAEAGEKLWASCTLPAVPWCEALITRMNFHHNESFRAWKSLVLDEIEGQTRE